MRCVVVSHFHWDREWYRTFEAFRARLVDAIDGVLDLLDADAGYRFLLDGQTVVLEDYLMIRPQQRERLQHAVRERRLSIGPWYVQPDSLLPSGEAHIRNLLRGRRVGEAFGPVSVVGYVPDSFGHPSQLPQILAGFGISTFIYWRGNDREIDTLGPVYRWEAPDGSAVEATLLREGYLNAACLPADIDEAVRRLTEVATRLAASGAADEPNAPPVLLMNGVDHMFPDAHVGAVLKALAQATGWEVQRGFLDDAVGDAVGQSRSPLPAFRGELTGGRIANLTPGVWSTRMALKLRNRRCETLLQGWAEPWTALARALGFSDERPSLARAWEEVLKNQAHDSICGCSIDAVAEQVMSRFDTAERLAEETVDRVLERLAGQGAERVPPWTVEQEIMVFNPSPHPRTDVVCVPLDVHPAIRFSVLMAEIHPFAFAARDAVGFAVDGRPARAIASADPTRTRWLPGPGPVDLEFVASDVPAFGCRRYTLTTTSEPIIEEIDEERVIETPEVSVRVAEDGTLDVRLGSQHYAGLLAVEDRGDRGDTYDYDGLTADAGATLAAVSVRRFRHPSGIQRLEVRRTFTLPHALEEDREQRSATPVSLDLTVEARVVPGVPRVDLVVEVQNTARDHRLRLLFPSGAPAGACRATTTFGIAQRSTAARTDTDWVHPAPTTFPHQGWVSANGLTVVAPGLPEAEVTPEGTIAITLLRAVGWLARFDLRSRPLPAGPFMAVEGAQILGTMRAHVSLLATADPVAAYDAELGLRGVLAGPGRTALASLLSLEPASLVLSALKPAEQDNGMILRVLNPTDSVQTASVRVGFPFSEALAVRLDETPAAHAVTRDTGRVRFEVPPHALRTVLLR